MEFFYANLYRSPPPLKNGVIVIPTKFLLWNRVNSAGLVNCQFRFTMERVTHLSQMIKQRKLFYVLVFFLPVIISDVTGKDAVFRVWASVQNLTPSF